jgi:basic membrane protein A and related proteins
MKKLMAAALVLTALLASASAQKPKLKVGFIYLGPVGEAGWTYAHEQGRLELEKATGVETIKVESVPEGGATPYLEQLVRQGANVIFTTSFGYMDQTLEAAKKYPNVIFAHATGYKRAPNVATYMADFYQVYYLNGLMAGALSKSGKIGYVGAFPIPEVKRHINAFALGVRAVNPKAVVNVKWINAWFDPNAAKEATEALIAEGNDVFAFTEDTPTVVQVAAKKGLPSFGHYSPMQDFAADSVVSGQLVDWGKIYIDFVKGVQSGKFNTKNLDKKDYWWLLGDKAVELGGKFGVPINPAFQAKLKAVAIKDPSSGKTNVYDLTMKRLAQMSAKVPLFDPFTGPIKDRKGLLRVAAGKRLTVGELTSLEWAAPAVVGSWPNEP